LQPLFDTHRISIAPLRYGAGIKGKVVEAMANGLPVVTTSTGAEGTGTHSGRDIVVANSATDFSAAVIKLYNDPTAWKAISENGLRSAGVFSPRAIRPILQRALDVGREL